MSEDDDPDISEFDIESRNWSKMQENMELIGFREGALKGKELSYQEGFNLGYSDGFKLGEFLGMMNGIKSLSCQSESDFLFKETSEPGDHKTQINLSNETCILCSEGKTPVSSTQPKQITRENFDDFLLSQKSYINEMIRNIKSHLELHFEIG